MPLQFCTIEATSVDEAREAGARELGVPPDDVSADPLGPGRYRVAISRADCVITIALSFDKFQAEIQHIALPIGDGAPPTRDRIIRALAQEGVTQGLLEEKIDHAVAAITEQGVEVRNVVVARGQRPTPVNVGKIVRHYLRPTEEEPSRCRRIVRQGELLIERAGSAPGEPGFTVTGDTLPAPMGEMESVVVGPGVEVDEAEMRWCVTAPGFGYLACDADGVPTVTPAVAPNEDGMRAYLDLLGPGADEAPVTREEVDAALEAGGMTHGSLTDQVEAAWATFQKHGRLPKPVCVVRGTPAVPGRDAGIDFAVDVRSAVGQVDEETGRIDYRERNAVRNVRTGQVLGTWHPAGAGEPGCTVDGKELPPTAGREGTLTAEENVETAEQPDGTVLLTAARNGMVVTKPGGIVSVVDLMQIPGDVDYSVGNFDATGAVHIKGTIRAGFRITAECDITVQESIEDALVEAGTELLVLQGIIGGENSLVRAGTRVTANFAQSARILCDGDVEIRDSASNSTIECGGKIISTEGHGRLIGGQYTAAAGLAARVIGSELGTRTIVTVGENPVVAEELRTLRDTMEAAAEEQATVGHALSAAMVGVEPGAPTPEQVVALRELIQARRDANAQCADLATTEAALQARLHEGTPPQVEVLEAVYPGVEISICGCRYQVEDALREVRFVLDTREQQVKIVPLDSGTASTECAEA